MQKEQDEKTMRDIAENLEILSHTNIATKEEFLHKLIENDIVETKMIKCNK